MQKMLCSANQMLKMIREACRNVRKCCVPFPPLSSDLRHWSLVLSYQLHSYEKGSTPAVFPQLLAGRLAHSASSPSHNGTCTSWMGCMTLVREWKMTSLLPCFQTRVISPCCSLTSSVLLSHATQWHGWLPEFSGIFLLISSFQSCLQVISPSVDKQAAVNQRRCQPYFSCWYKPLLNPSLSSSFGY